MTKIFFRTNLWILRPKDQFQILLAIFYGSVHVLSGILLRYCLIAPSFPFRADSMLDDITWNIDFHFKANWSALDQHSNVDIDMFSSIRLMYYFDAAGHSAFTPVPFPIFGILTLFGQDFKILGFLGSWYFHDSCFGAPYNPLLHNQLKAYS